MNKINYIKKHTSWFILVIFGSLLYYLISVALLNNYQEKQQSFFNAEMDAFQSKIDATLTTYETFSQYLFEHNFNTPYVSRLMALANQADDSTKQRLRNELYAAFSSDYDMFTQFSFRQLHFHLANGDSFLRFHRPDLFGDNLTEYRDSIRLIGTHHEYIFGFEEGRVYNGYRFVYPLFHQEQYVGSVEVSISMSTVSELFSELYPDIKTTFVISEEVVKRLVFENELSNYEPHPHLKGYYVDVDVQNVVGDKCQLEIDPCYVFEELMRLEPDLLDTKENISRIVSHQDHTFLVQFLQIRNITDQPVAYFIGISEDDTYQNFYDQVGQDILLVGLLFLLLFISTFVYQRKQNELEIISSTDKLTSLPNRRNMLELAQREALRHERYKTPVSIIMTDIDLFKRVNDTHGHRVGDDVLIQFGQILKDVVRNLDVVSRWGGEEFLILLVETNLDEALEVAERLRQAVEAADFENVEKITASFGVATLKDNENLDEFIDRSDRALYQAKAEGRNTIRVSNHQTQTK